MTTASATRHNSKTEQDFTSATMVDGIVVLTVATTAVATTAKCSSDTLDSSISYPVFLSLLGLASSTMAHRRLHVSYTVDQGANAVVRYVDRTWKGTIGAAHKALFNTSARTGDWMSYLQSGIATLFNAAVQADDQFWGVDAAAVETPTVVETPATIPTVTAIPEGVMVETPAVAATMGWEHMGQALPGVTGASYQVMTVNGRFLKQVKQDRYTGEHADISEFNIC